jgi:DNA-binding beta-propeller fold protein YncE
VDSASNRVYVADAGNSRIQVFDAEGVFMKTWGSVGAGDGEFNNPTDVSVDSARGRVYVADPYNDNRVQMFATDGVFIKKWQNSGVGNGQFNGPFAVHADSGTGRLFVADAGNERIQVFDAGGAYLTQWDSGSPFDIVINDSNDRAYALDLPRYRVQVYRIYN